MTTRWLITGAGGMLGTEMRAVLERDRPHDAVNALSRADLDVTDGAAVRATVRDCAEASGGENLVVVNCAAYTNVDGAESDEQAAFAINAAAPGRLAVACAEVGARLVQVSTDYVFGGAALDGTASGGTASGNGASGGAASGSAGSGGAGSAGGESASVEVGGGDSGGGASLGPFAEDAAVAPVNAYGRTKLAGERAVTELLPATGYVVRTAWLYGEGGDNFVSAVLAKLAAGETVTAVADQHGQPTWTLPVARGIAALAVSGAPAGIYHATASGTASRYDQARAAYEFAGADPDLVRPAGSTDQPRPARRPTYSALAHHAWTAAGLPPWPNWRTMLADAFTANTFTRP